VALAATAVFFSCTSSSSGKSVAGADPARGRVIYQTQCIACHNSDPKKAGALGPDVFGSNLELLEARIMRAQYPEGYKPKRETHTMVPLPHLKADIPAIQAYLNQ
jgi:mono/diheme cytochrome c family protein